MKRPTITDKELITALRRMTPETGSLICLGCGYEHNCSVHGCAVLRAAVGRLEELPDLLSNDPLTLEELREMDGEPVWVTENGYQPRWALVSVRWKANNIVYITFNNGSQPLAQTLLYDGYKIYRHKPEEGRA